MLHLAKPFCFVWPIPATRPGLCLVCSKHGNFVSTVRDYRVSLTLVTHRLDNNNPRNRQGLHLDHLSYIFCPFLAN